ncbi:hypothetical protein [Sinosporangium siamense]|uniref:Uncharacterized protein n=1 Tax=Sinosporangium siamense TaxID=1367973 RepID=A0A919VEB8_9ACTN|nr:hypothetical protein [Sinosporangium siamense]GII94969.1 hypothetical protein Ssi02_52000 [Sinosporangium siamense]
MKAAKSLLVAPGLLLGLVVAPQASATGAGSTAESAEAAVAACSAKAFPRGAAAKLDKPAKGAAAAVPGVTLRYMPKGFTHGKASWTKAAGVKTYGYTWKGGDKNTHSRRDADTDRDLWVRVICWPGGKKLTDLRRLPVTAGKFTKNSGYITIGKQKVAVTETSGALGVGRMVGWVARPGVIVTVKASGSLARELPHIVQSVRVS